MAVPMPLTRLTLTDFRSYATATIEPGPGFVVLTGDNGAGKTNVLEAVSLLAPGRGLRSGALGDMARKGGAGGFSVSEIFYESMVNLRPRQNRSMQILDPVICNQVQQVIYRLLGSV